MNSRLTTRRLIIPCFWWFPVWFLFAWLLGWCAGQAACPVPTAQTGPDAGSCTATCPEGRVCKGND